MNSFDGFFVGAATAAHQVEGNNKNSDYWTMEQLEYSMFKEPSLDAIDHYHRYKEDIDLLKESGLTAYRFSIEWARIEPQPGIFNQKEIEHYKDVISYCKTRKIEPIITMHHFSSPKWLIENGGWENEDTIDYFSRYCEHVISELGDLITYVCTINEANMGLQLTAIAQDRMNELNKDNDVQIGMNSDWMKHMKKTQEELAKAFHFLNPDKVAHFLTPRTGEGDQIIIRSHEMAREKMKSIFPHLKIGLTLSLHDFQALSGGEAIVEKKWEEEFLHYMSTIKKDDFIGLQNYTRKLIGPQGALPVPDGFEKTQANYEFYPQALSNVIRKVNSVTKIPILVTESGVATEDDTRRVEFIKVVMQDIQDCLKDGIPVIGYLYWSLLDNFEWMSGFEPKFGLISVDRETQKRYPKPSLSYLGHFAHKK